MALKLALNPITGEFDLVQNLSGLPTIYAKLDGTNQPFTGDVEIVSGLDSKLTINAEGTALSYGTGGDTVTDIVVGSDTYRVHKFTTVGSSTFVAPDEITNLEVLVVGSGGGGGNSRCGGGGGAGRFILDSTYTPTSAENITVTVGAGGSAGGAGNQSVFGTITAAGGGVGGVNVNAGGNGGSGGGSGGYFTGTSASGGTQTGGDGLGNNGGKGYIGNGEGGGGGGGSGAVGGAAGNGYGGAGAAGTASDITGALLFYAAGGGGGAYGYTRGMGGSSIGGNGGGGSGGAASTAGAVNTGSGGGGYGTDNGGSPRAASGGGSGVVIVRYIPLTSTKTTPKIVLEGSGTQTAAIYTDPNDSDKFKIDVASTTALEIDPATQDAVFSGDISAANLSGTNTGDQDLSGYVPYTGATTDVDLGDHTLTCGGTEAGQSTIASGLVVNDNGGNAAADDFRAETVNNANAFVVDASADKILVGVPLVSTSTATIPTLYFGDDSTDGSWRLVPSGTSLKVQRRESATWVDKGEFTA